MRRRKVFIASRQGGLTRINRLRESQFKSVGLGVHLVDFKWHLAFPYHALQGKRLSAARAPAAVRAPDEKRTIGRHFEAQAPRGKALQEWEAGALIAPVDL